MIDIVKTLSEQPTSWINSEKPTSWILVLHDIMIWSIIYIYYLGCMHICYWSYVIVSRSFSALYGRQWRAAPSHSAFHQCRQPQQGWIQPTRGRAAVNGGGLLPSCRWEGDATVVGLHKYWSMHSENILWGILIGMCRFQHLGIVVVAHSRVENQVCSYAKLFPSIL